MKSAKRFGTAAFMGILALGALFVPVGRADLFRGRTQTRGPRARSFRVLGRAP